MPNGCRRAKKSIEQQSELLRELGLGGSAVGTGINTIPTIATRPSLTSHASPAKTHAGRRCLCVQSNLAMASVSSALRNLALEVIHFQ